MLFFDKIYISDEFSPPDRKHNLRMFEKFLQDFSLKGNECIYIGDSEKIDGTCQKLGFLFLKQERMKEYMIEL